MDGTELNLFSSQEFVHALTVFFAGQTLALRDVELAGKVWRVPCVDGRVLYDWQFVDFYEPHGDALGGASEAIEFLPHACQGVVPVAEWLAKHPAEDLKPAPFVEWNLFGTWAEYEAWLAKEDAKHASDTRRRRRRLESELGPMQFTEHDPSAEAFDACVRWKSDQCASLGWHDLFENPDNVSFFQKLKDEGVLKVSTLRAGGRLVSSHFGARYDRRFYSWVPAYDGSLGAYAPGRLLLYAMLQASIERGDEQFDFLLGDEPYKWSYATHTRVIGASGKPPLSYVVSHATRRGIHRALSQTPTVRKALRAVLKKGAA